MPCCTRLFLLSFCERRKRSCISKEKLYLQSLRQQTTSLCTCFLHMLYASLCTCFLLPVLLVGERLKESLFLPSRHLKESLFLAS